MFADGLFVYGTLREGGSNTRWLERTRPEGRCRAWAPGRLFHLPEAGYPAMVMGPIPGELPPCTGWVTGEFIGYEDDEAMDAALFDLDQLEETDQGLFERTLTPVYLEGGQVYRAWVYVFPNDRVSRLEREATEIPDGDWSGYLS